MENDWQQSHRELYHELKIARDKAGQRFPDRLADIETVFAVADALRGSLIELDGIARKSFETKGFSLVVRVVARNSLILGVRFGMNTA